MSRDLDRRSFLKLVGGGIVVFVRLGTSDAIAQGRAYPTDINAYLRIGEDGRVTVFSGKIEMGQGVLTSLAQMAAEDLGVGLDQLEMIMGDTDRCPWDMGTFGSLTTRMFGPALRAAAAEARQVLLLLASERLGVPKDRLVVEKGVVSVTGEPARQVTYGALAKGQAITRTVDEKAVLRAVPEFTVMGRSPHRLDAVDKVTGAGKYAADVRLPGLLHARLLRPPAHGATLARVDASEAAKLDGVTVVNQDGLVAVLHADPEAAEAALARLRPEWNAAPAGRTPTASSTLSWAAPHSPRSGARRGTWKRHAGRRPGGSRAPTRRDTWPTRRWSPTPRRRRSRTGSSRCGPRPRPPSRPRPGSPRPWASTRRASG